MCLAIHPKVVIISYHDLETNCCHWSNGSTWKSQAHRHFCLGHHHLRNDSETERIPPSGCAVARVFATRRQTTIYRRRRLPLRCSLRVVERATYRIFEGGWRTGLLCSLQKRDRVCYCGSQARENLETKRGKLGSAEGTLWKTGPDCNYLVYMGVPWQVVYWHAEGVDHQLEWAQREQANQRPPWRNVGAREH